MRSTWVTSSSWSWMTAPGWPRGTSVPLVGVGAVGEDLAGHLQPGALGGEVELGQHRGEQDEAGVDRLDRARDRVGQRRVLAGLVVERAVRLDVGDAAAFGRGHAGERADLVDHHGFELGGAIFIGRRPKPCRSG